MKKIFLVFLFISMVIYFNPIIRKSLPESKYEESATLKAQSGEDDPDTYDIYCMLELDVSEEHDQLLEDSSFEEQVFVPGELDKSITLEEAKRNHRMKSEMIKEHYESYNLEQVRELGLDSYDYSISCFGPYVELRFDSLVEYNAYRDDIEDIVNTNDIVNTAYTDYITFPDSTIEPALVSDPYPLADCFEDINVSNATYTGEGINVGVLENFRPDSFINMKEGYYISNFRSTSYFQVTSQHGSIVSSLIGGNTGVAKNATIVFCSALEYGFLEALNMLVYTNQCYVINVSFQVNSDGFYTRLCAYFDYISNLLGISIVCAAGNSTSSGVGGTVDVPGSALNVITVGSLNKRGTVSAFSSFLNYTQHLYKPNLVAPGENIVGLANYSDSLSGTSFSAPLVSGVIALILEEYPTLIGRSFCLRMAIYSTCRRLANQTNVIDDFCGYGVIDYEAIRHQIHIFTYTYRHLNEVSARQNIYSTTLTIRPGKRLKAYVSQYCYGQSQWQNVNIFEQQVPNICRIESILEYKDTGVVIDNACNSCIQNYLEFSNTTDEPIKVTFRVVLLYDTDVTWQTICMMHDIKDIDY